MDWSGLVGGYTSLAIDNNDYAHISYYRDADGDLMYANWTGSDWNIVTIDSLGDVGKFTSIDLDSNDIPHVSYYDVTNKALKHAWWDGSSWQNETADSSADVGQYSSIAIDTWDMPHISYYDATNGDLKYASWVGIWANEVVDSVGNVGRFTSLKLDSSNNPYIAYNDVTNFELKYAKGMLGPSPPGAPQGLAAMPDDSQVSLSWTSPLFDGGAPINNYNIHRGFSPGSETFLVTVGNVLNYLDSSVTNGITYYYKVSAVNGVGEGPLSNEASATPATVPGAPTGLTAIAGDSFVNITWNSPVSDGGSPITNYSIYRGTTSGGETFLAKIGMMLYYNDTSVTNGITYFYKVSANNSVGEGPFSNEVSGTPNAGPTVPSSPQNLHASAGDSYVNLTWNPPASDGGSSIANYRIYRGMTPGGEVFLANLGIVLHYNDTSVANGITYYYKVSASNAIGEGPLSNEASGTPNALTEPVNQPPECTISSPANSASVSGMVTISGTSSDSDGSVQKVEVKIDDGSWVKVNGKTTWSFEWNTSAVSDGQHEIHARAYDGEDYSEETDVTVFVNNTGGVEEEKTIFEQAWFWILIAVILVLLIFALIYLWKRKNRKKKEPKEEKGEEETTSLESDSDISEFKDI